MARDEEQRRGLAAFTKAGTHMPDGYAMVRMHYEAGYAISSIADKLGCSERTVHRKMESCLRLTRVFLNAGQ